MNEQTLMPGIGTVEVLFYRVFDGVFTGRSYIGQADRVEAKTPPGCAAIEARLVADWQSQRVDLATGAVVDWQPPQPEPTKWETWTWDATTRRWTPAPTLAAHWRSVRAERDRRLSGTDWVALRGLERGDPIPKAWKDYRQALRDITTQADPTAIVWPTPPAA